MIGRVVLALTILLAFTSAAGAGMFINSFDGVYQGGGGVELCLNDIYVNTGGVEWLASMFYCELEEGSLFQQPTFGIPMIQWMCLVGPDHYDTWLAPGVSIFADGNELASLFSGDSANAAVSLTFIADLQDGKVPAWEGITARFAFTPETTGVWAFVYSAKGHDRVVHTGVITDGEIVFEAPIPGDLNVDGYVNSDDLDVVRANWAAERTILGCFDYGDPSADGEVGDDDLEIVRANWGRTAGVAAGVAAGVTAVPEPGVVLVVLAGVVLLSGRRLA